MRTGESIRLTASGIRSAEDAAPPPKGSPNSKRRRRRGRSNATGQDRSAISIRHERSSHQTPVAVGGLSQAAQVGAARQIPRCGTRRVMQAAALRHQLRSFAPLHHEAPRGHSRMIKRMNFAGWLPSTGAVTAFQPCHAPDISVVDTPLVDHTPLARSVVHST